MLTDSSSVVVGPEFVAGDLAWSLLGLGLVNQVSCFVGVDIHALLPERLCERLRGAGALGSTFYRAFDVGAPGGLLAGF